MNRQKEARGQGGLQESTTQGIHGNNDAVGLSRRTPLFDDALAYRKARLELIPLRVRDKVPADRQWQAREYDGVQVMDRARREGLNLGVRLPADIVVVDVDPRNFPDGRDSLADLAASFGLDLSTAPHVLTGNLDHPGHHYYFRKPKGTTLLDSVDGFEGIEFKSLGRQVVAAGSIHPSGGLYRWAPNSPPLYEMPDLPIQLMEKARRPDRPQRVATGAGELTPEQLAKTLEQLDPFDFGGKGGQKRWQDLMMACHFATDGEGRQEFIDWCMGDPSYSGQEWRVGNRWDSLHSNKADVLTTASLQMFLNEVGGGIAAPDPEDDFDIWEEEGAPSEQPRHWQFLTIDELEALPPPRWLIPGLLTESSLAAIYGAPESGKSFLAVDMALSIASGLDWHGRDVLAGGVLYIAAEGAPGLGKRVRAWKNDHGAQGANFAFHLMRDEINFAAEKDTAVRTFVQEVVAELGPLRLIVIDTLNQTAAGADENSAKDMSRYITNMKRLRDATGATVVVVHHSGKDTSKGMRGSTALLGAMDTTIEVERMKDRYAIDVAVRKQKDAEKDPGIRFNLEKVGDSLVLHPSVMAAAEEDFAVDPIVELACELANDKDGTVGLKELVEAVCSRLGVADKTARRKIADAIPSGRENAVTTNQGKLIWQQPVEVRNPKRGILVITEEQG
ncbi:AAA family ATPase [Stutzerimonas kunmingensis]|uniref:AAA family ATPase n=1 Tax=Stutzerimonas kunmingensis TaxID=1211807 RepID=UPI00241CDF25|nr:AAA family ATPase [Stutzerimonas kunmingensis]